MALAALHGASALTDCIDHLTSTCGSFVHLSIVSSNGRSLGVLLQLSAPLLSSLIGDGELPRIDASAMEVLRSS